jgi:hypothetical protein
MLRITETLYQCTNMYKWKNLLSINQNLFHSAHSPLMLLKFPFSLFTNNPVMRFSNNLQLTVFSGRLYNLQWLHQEK